MKKVSISDENHDKLARFANGFESLNDVLNRVIEVFEEVAKDYDGTNDAPEWVKEAYDDSKERGEL